MCTPNISKRYSSSASTNAHNLFLSNNVTWKKYPPREYSVIGTTSMFGAKELSRDVFMCIPLDKQANIAITPEYDLWFSFKPLAELGFYSLGDFFNKVVKCTPLSPKLTSYEILKKELEKPEFLIKTKESDTRAIKDCFENSDNALKTIEDLLDPEKNGFKHLPFIKFIHGTFINKEVWTNGDVIMIYIEQIENIKSRLGI